MIMKNIILSSSIAARMNYHPYIRIPRSWISPPALYWKSHLQKYLKMISTISFGSMTCSEHKDWINYKLTTKYSVASKSKLSNLRKSSEIHSILNLTSFVDGDN